MRIGPLASGAAVIQNEEVLHKYIEPYQRKVLGVDMETYGVYYACENAFEPVPEFFSIKAVSDYANSQKNDGYQEYCAFLSANFFFELIPELINRSWRGINNFIFIKIKYSAHVREISRLISRIRYR